MGVDDGSHFDQRRAKMEMRAARHGHMDREQRLRMGFARPRDRDGPRGGMARYNANTEMMNLHRRQHGRKYERLMRGFERPSDEDGAHGGISRFDKPPEDPNA